MLEKGTHTEITELKSMCKNLWMGLGFKSKPPLPLPPLFTAALILTCSTSRRDWSVFVYSGKSPCYFLFVWFCLNLFEFV